MSAEHKPGTMAGQPRTRAGVAARRCRVVLAGVCAAWVTSPASAAAQTDALLSNPTLVTLVTLGALGLVPFLFMATTSFVKLAIVLSVLRNALGLGQVPSGMVITVLAAILTLYVMAPVAGRIQSAAAAPAADIDLARPLTGKSADAVTNTFNAAKAPLQTFLYDNAGQRERALFQQLAQRARGDDAEVNERDLLVVLPAFLISELKEAFQIAFVVFIPFLVIDMVVANVLLALGMHMLSPTTISLPFKLLLFVLVDGWYVLSEALVASYR